jgi:uncharacterized protein YifN (PemK superfamily)
MSLNFQPKPGQVVMCDFRGYVVPEMVKVRPVVVIARNRKNRQLVTVVPLSTTAPNALEDHHHELSGNPLPGKERITCWAKCDMVATVSLSRLDRFKAGHRQYVAPILPQADFEAICLALLNALGLAALSVKAVS